MALPGFAVSAVTNILASNTSQTVAVSGTTALITNTGTSVAYMLMGATVSSATGVPVLPNQSIALTVSGGTLAVIGQGANLNVACGT